MTLITRYQTAPSVSGRPSLAWNTGLTPNRRWVPASLPASGSSLAEWKSQYGNLILSPRDPVIPLTVESEAGVRYAATSGVAGQGLYIDTNSSTMRTVVIIARPNVGDLITGSSSRIARFGDTAEIKQQDVDTASVTGGLVSLTATRGKWHVYAVSLPPMGSANNGVFVVDGNSTEFTYSDATWATYSLRLASSSSSTSRQLRMLEIITSAATFTAAELNELYAKAKTWYPDLTW